MPLDVLLDSDETLLGVFFGARQLEVAQPHEGLKVFVPLGELVCAVDAIEFDCPLVFD
jgi:hypothetical protein